MASISVVLVAVAATFRDLLSADHVPAYRDLLVFVAPFKHFVGERLRSGELPLWNPYVYLGTPFLASLQSGVLYPPTCLLLLPFPLGLNLFLLAHYAIAALGFWILLRSRGLSQAPAAIGTVTFVLGGFLVSMLSLTNNLQSVAWCPWALWLWMSRVEQGRDRPARDAALTLVLGLELLGGAPEVLVMTLFLMAAWAAYRAGRQPRRFLALGLALFGVTGLAVLLTAFQTLPTLEYISQSERGSGLGYGVVSSWSLQPVSLLQLVLPRSAATTQVAGIQSGLESTEPWIYSIYFGLVALCLLAAAAWTAPDRGFWFAMIVLFLLLALGIHTPLFPAIYQAFPWGVGKFRFPEKFFFVVHLSAAFLVAEGAQSCVRGDRRALRAAVAAAATLAALAGAAVYLRHRQPQLYLQCVTALSGRFEPVTSFVPLALSLGAKAERALLILGSFAAMVAFRRAQALGSATFAALLVALVAADVSSTHDSLHPFVSWRELQATPPFVDVDELRGTHQRFFPYQTFSDPPPGQAPTPINGLEPWAFVRDYADPSMRGSQLLWRIQLLDLPMITKTSTLGGVDGIIPRSNNELRRALSASTRERAIHLLRVFGASHLVGPTELRLADLEPLASARGTPIFGYRLRGPAPAAYLAARLTLVRSDAEAFERMSAPEFRPGSDVTVGELPADWRSGEEAADAGEVSVLDWREERIRLSVSAARDAFLVLNESFFPGWEARVDETPSRIFRANVLVRGVVVPRGDHVVDFVYRPASFRLGVGISLLGIVGLLAICAKRRRLTDVRA